VHTDIDIIPTHINVDTHHALVKSERNSENVTGIRQNAYTLINAGLALTYAIRARVIQ
tara:strand:- start:1144 stop:1317 length:174 start_codon:yes stop_codon:yes gene_type:complete